MARMQNIVGLALGCAALVLIATSCKSTPPKSAVDIAPDFECSDRSAEYTAIGLLYEEQGIRMTCKGNRPIVTRFYEKRDATREEQGAVVSSQIWEARWNELNGTGWRNLSDCTNPGARKNDPIFTFVLRDKLGERSFQCQGRELPYPYDRLRNSLDMAGSEVHEGAPEP